MKIYYFDGFERKGPIESVERLRELIREGKIRPRTILENEGGRQAEANEFPSLREELENAPDERFESPSTSGFNKIDWKEILRTSREIKFPRPPLIPPFYGSWRFTGIYLFVALIGLLAYAGERGYPTLAEYGLPILAAVGVALLPVVLFSFLVRPRKFDKNIKKPTTSRGAKIRRERASRYRRLLY